MYNQDELEQFLTGSFDKEKHFSINFDNFKDLLNNATPDSYLYKEFKAKDFSNLKDFVTNHSYYCSESHRNHCEYESWEDFKYDFIGSDDFDIDRNFLFRFDFQENQDKPNSYELKLFFIQQRKGHLATAFIKNIQPDDMPEIMFMIKVFQKLQHHLGHF